MTARKKTNKFDCQEIVKHVHDYLDNRLNEEELHLFEDHLDYCLPCDKKIEFEKKLKHIVKTKGKEYSVPQELETELKRMLSDSL